MADSYGRWKFTFLHVIFPFVFSFMCISIAHKLSYQFGIVMCTFLVHFVYYLPDIKKYFNIGNLEEILFSRIIIFFFYIGFSLTHNRVVSTLSSICHTAFHIDYRWKFRRFMKYFIKHWRKTFVGMVRREWRAFSFFSVCLFYCFIHMLFMEYYPLGIIFADILVMISLVCYVPTLCCRNLSNVSEFYSLNIGWKQIGFISLIIINFVDQFYIVGKDLTTVSSNYLVIISFISLTLFAERMVVVANSDIIDEINDLEDFLNEHATEIVYWGNTDFVNQHELWAHIGLNVSRAQSSFFDIDLDDDDPEVEDQSFRKDDDDPHVLFRDEIDQMTDGQVMHKFLHSDEEERERIWSKMYSTNRLDNFRPYMNEGKDDLVKRVMSVLDNTINNDDSNFLSINMEKIILLVTNLVLAQGHGPRFMIVITYLHSLSNRSVTHACMRMVKRIMGEMESNKVLQGQSIGDAIEDLDKYLHTAQATYHSHVIIAFRRMITMCVCAPIMLEKNLPFDPERLDFLDQRYIKSAKSGDINFDLILDGLQSIQIFCDTGWKAVMGGKIDLHSGNAYSQWYAEFSELKSKQFLTTESETNDDFINIDEFNERILLLRKKGITMIDMLKSQKDPASRMMDVYLAEVKNMVTNIDLRKRAFSTKKMPFATYLYGPSGVGKTSTAMAIYSLYGSIKNKPVGQGYLYTRNKDSEYDDGYLPTMWAELNDEIGSYKNAKDDPSMKDHFKRINTTGFLTKQAALERKDAIPYNVELYIGTGNKALGNFEAMFNNPSAALRRFNVFIEVSLKDGVNRITGVMDQLYTVSYVGYLKDITVDEAKRNKFCELQPYIFEDRPMILVDWLTFERFMRKRIQEFDDSQNSFLKSTREYMSARQCACGYMSYACQCLTAQGYESEETLVDSDDEDGKPNFITTRYRNWYAERSDIPDFEFDDVTSFFKNIELKVKAFGYRSRARFVNWFIGGGIPGRIASQPLRKLERDARRSIETLDSLSFYEIGERVNITLSRKIKIPAALPILGSAIGVLLAGTIITIGVTGITKRVKGQFGSHPVQEKLPKRKVFQRFKFPGKLPPASVNPFDVYVDNIRRNTARLLICDNKGNVKGFTNSLCIRGDIFLTTAHGIPEEMWVKVQFGDNIHTLKLHHVPSQNISKLPEHDMCLIRIMGVPSSRDLKNLIVDKDLNVGVDERDIGFEGTMITRNKKGRLLKPYVKAKSQQKYMYEYKGRQITGKGFSTSVDETTYSGMCGSPVVVATSRGPVLLGIHVAGHANRGFVRPVSKEILNKFILNFDFPEVPPFTTFVAQGLNEFEISDKSIINQIDGDYRVFGDVIDYYIPPRHSVRDSLLRPYLRDDWKTDHGPPNMRHVKGRKDLNPYAHAMNAWTATATNWNHNKEKICNDAIIEHYISSLRHDFHKVMVYDVKTALAGADSVYGVDAMDPHTSVGFPFNKPKNKVGIIREDEKVWLDFSPECREMYDRFIERLDAGESCYPIFKASLKDEPVSEKKRGIAKTRVFSSGQWAWNVICRQLFLSVDKIIKENFVLTMTLAGVDPESEEWEVVYNYLKSKGDCASDGDWEHYDKPIASVEMIWAGDVLISVMEAAGIPERFRKWAWILVYDLAFPVTLVKTTLLQFKGSNPSGNPLTTILNILVNIRRMMSCFTTVVPNVIPSDYFELVGATFLGDDNLQTSTKEVMKYFNCISMEKYFKQFGLVYTSASKEKVSRPYCGLDEMTILKRKFIVDNELGIIKAPREWKSLMKSLNVRTKTSISSYDHAIESLLNLNREMFHYGREKFEEVQKEIYVLIDKAELSYFDDSPLPTYDEVWESFRSAYNKITLYAQSGNIFDDIMNEVPQYEELICAVLGVPSLDTFGEDQFLRVTHAVLAVCSLGRKRTFDNVRHIIRRLEEENGVVGVSNEKYATLQASVSLDFLQLHHLAPLMGEWVVLLNKSKTGKLEIVSYLYELKTFRLPEPAVNKINEYLIVMGASLRAQMDTIKTDGEFEFDRLKQFLPIDDFEWSLGSGVGESFFCPWEKYFTNALIKPLVSQSAYISCSLDLRFVYTKNSRFCGKLCFAYEPCFTKRQIDLVTTNPNFSVYCKAMQCSMLDNITINPSERCDHNNILNIQNLSSSPWFSPHSLAPLTDIGFIHINELSQLERLSDEVGSSVKVTVYARAVNLKHQIPTGLPAGFDLVNMVRPPQHLFVPYKEIKTDNGIPMEQLESLEFYKNDEFVENLKQKGSGQGGVDDYIRSTAVGIVRQDITPEASSLSISDIAQKFTYFFDCSWSPSTTPGQRLCSIGVSPWTCIVNGGRRHKVSPSHLSAMARLFSYWRGSIKYKFVFVSSPLFSGRVTISWTPFFFKDMNAYGCGLGPISKTFDLSEGSDIEFVVPYAGRTAYLECRPNRKYKGLGGIYALHDNFLEYEHFSMNGVVNVVVEDSLQSPLDANLTMLVYVAGGDDIAFMEFNDRFVKDNYGERNATIKSRDCSEINTSPKNNGKSKMSKMKDAIFNRSKEKNSKGQSNDTESTSDQDFEPKVSIAPHKGVDTLYEGLKSYMFYGAVGIIDEPKSRSMTTGASRIIRYITPTFPMYRSGHPGAVHTIDKKKFQCVRTTLVNYVSSMFVGVSGSIKWRVKPIVNRGNVRLFTVDKSTVAPNLSEGWYGFDLYQEYEDIEPNTRLSLFTTLNMSSGLNNLVTTTSEEAVSTLEVNLVSRYLYRYATRSNPYSNSDDDSNSQFLRINKIIQQNLSDVDPFTGVDGDLWWVNGEDLKFHHYLRPLPFWVENEDSTRV